MEIVIQRSFDWTILVAAAAGLGGALLGATAIFLLEFWRQLLIARSAARIIRMELQNNATVCILSITHRQQPIQEISEKAWSEFGVQLAPLLPDQALFQMTKDYGALFIVRNWMQEIASNHAEARAQITEWVKNVQPSLVLLRQIEARRRLAQFFDLLLGRITLPAQVARGGSDDAASLIDSVLEDVQRVVDAGAGETTED